MANWFINTFQNLANSFSSTTNSFTWDSALRKFQYAIAGIILVALSILETRNKMQCSVGSQSFPTHYFNSSYCFESWYHISEGSNSTKIKYHDSLRYFKWYILFPPLIIIILSFIYGAIVNGFLVQTIKTARGIMDMLNVKVEESCSSDAETGIDVTIQSMAISARHFSETNLRSKKNKSLCWYFGLGTLLKKMGVQTTYGGTENGDQAKLLQVSCHTANEVKVMRSGSSLGENIFIWYNLYLFFCFAINGMAVGFLNPYFFWLPNAIACYYRKKDAPYHWCICSVPGYHYFHVAVIIVMLNHIVGVLVAALSFFYINVFIPREIRSAGTAIGAYTRDLKQREKLARCWKKYGKDKVDSLTATSRFLLALIYQNIDRTLCFVLVIALIDIEKDREAIKTYLPLLIEDIVRMDIGEPALVNDEKEEKIVAIREIIINSVDTEQLKSTIQENLLQDLVTTYLNSPEAISKLFQAQQIHRITGIQLPKLSHEMKGQFVTFLQERKESDFESLVVYSKFLSAVYDLSKVDHFFTLMESSEIGHLNGAETIEHISDNNQEVVAVQDYEGCKALDASGCCWWSSDATIYNWIRRSWDQEHVIKLIAIQGSQVNCRSAPVTLSFTANLEPENDEEGSWVAVSETYHSYNWLENEWRVFPVYLFDETSSSLSHPSTKCIQINISNNDGAQYFEVQMIKIYGSKV